jgi:hypothetical protein
LIIFKKTLTLINKKPQKISANLPNYGEVCATLWRIYTSYKQV